MFYQFISNDLIFIQTKLFCRSSAKVRNCKIMRKKDIIFAGILIVAMGMALLLQRKRSRNWQNRQ